MYSDISLIFLSMYKRLLSPSLASSFFLFGARGTGKSTFLEEFFRSTETTWIDLLDADQENLFSNNPTALRDLVAKDRFEWVVIDEIQKSPKLLDEVHRLIEKGDTKFALTGSSARKLKRGGANLLAGRAFVYDMYPLTHLELRTDFNVLDVVNWGSLPGVFKYSDHSDKQEFLYAYVDAYLKEEIFQEQLVRSAKPFRNFLAIASQSSGTTINLQKIANGLGVDWATVRTYFDILEDTLLGFQLPPYEKSVRKRQLKSNKFYLFDIGVKRALDRTLGITVSHGQQLGPLFEHLVISEMLRLNSYSKKRYQFSYLATHSGLEIDLVVKRPGAKTALIEIKSGNSIPDNKLKHLKAITNENPEEFEAYCFCQEAHARKTDDGITVIPWQEGIKEIGLA